MEYEFDLGDYQREITTSNQEARTWFNRGLIWAYAFNHAEAVRCFERVVTLDPVCAMGYWGIAYALGPNYNKPWSSFDENDLKSSTKRAHHAIATARVHASAMTPLERSLINALSFRYPKEEPGNCTEWNENYAMYLGVVYRQFPEDFDVIALYCDALMNLTPWALWDIKTGLPAPKAQTYLVKKILDRALTRDEGYDHPGILHLYIHLTEMCPTPEMSLPMADSLRFLTNDAGHLLHMPTHIYMLCGDYGATIHVNTKAIAADQKYLTKHPDDHFYHLYLMHNFHFKLYAANMMGRRKVALATGAELEAAISEDLLRVKSPPMADLVEGFVGLPVHALVRFGEWEQIIALDLPRDEALYCVTTAMVHYAKGVAFAATDRVPEAEAERVLFHQSMGRVPESRTIFNNRCVDILKIGAAMLDGEIAYRRGEYDSAFALLRVAVQRDDSLLYDEPWGWMQPTRHALGALLLERAQVLRKEAQMRREQVQELCARAPELRAHGESVLEQGKSLCLLGHMLLDQPQAVRPLSLVQILLKQGESLCAQGSRLVYPGEKEDTKALDFYEEALNIYMVDLGIEPTLPRPLRHPSNIWALHGYHECLVKLERHEEVREAARELKIRAKLADPGIQSSCFCRRVE